MSRGGLLVRGGCLLLAVAAGMPVLSADLDAEIVEWHSQYEHAWAQIRDYAEQLREAGAWPPSAGGGAAAGAAFAAGEGAGGVALKEAPVSAELMKSLRELELEFKSIQRQAQKIGAESPTNAELSAHPHVNEYVQSLRSFNPKVQEAVKELAKAVKRATGKKPRKFKPKSSEELASIPGFDTSRARELLRNELSKDGRPFKAKAMETILHFREGQLAMADKQQDLQRTMSGPDWPKADWPLSSQDAKLIGLAETALQQELDGLNALIEPIGGLPAVHESGDERIVVQLGLLCRMMSGYADLVDRHITAAKRASKGKQKSKKKGTSPASAGAPAADAEANAQASGDGSMRDRLLNFGAPLGGGGGASPPPGQQQPFAWLREGADGTAGGGSFASRWGHVKGAIPSVPGAGARRSIPAWQRPVVIDSFAPTGGPSAEREPLAAGAWSTALPVYSPEL